MSTTDRVLGAAKKWARIDADLRYVLGPQGDDMPTRIRRTIIEERTVLAAKALELLQEEARELCQDEAPL